MNSLAKNRKLLLAKPFIVALALLATWTLMGCNGDDETNQLPFLGVFQVIETSPVSGQQNFDAFQQVLIQTTLRVDPASLAGRVKARNLTLGQEIPVIATTIEGGTIIQVSPTTQNASWPGNSQISITLESGITSVPFAGSSDSEQPEILQGFVLFFFTGTNFDNNIFVPGEPQIISVTPSEGYIAGGPVNPNQGFVYTIVFNECVLAESWAGALRAYTEFIGENDVAVFTANSDFSTNILWVYLSGDLGSGGKLKLDLRPGIGQDCQGEVSTLQDKLSRLTILPF